MPEIAEVETVRRTLLKQILNKRITNIDIYYPKMIESNIADFNNLINESFIDIKRIGKYLIFITEKFGLISHLRMEGKFYIKNKDDEKGKHEHLKFTFNDNVSLRYEDTRKFGRMCLVNKEDINKYEGIKKQGYEPMSEYLNKEYLFNKIHKSNKTIKELLLDQTIISGLGNIYVDEVLFYARIIPTRLGKNVSISECYMIVEGANTIIEKAILNGGTTIRSYTSSLGVKGNYQEYLQVHQRENEKCYVCGNDIIKTRIGGRGTYYCPNCQK